MKRILKQLLKWMELLTYIALLIIAAYLILESFGVIPGTEGQNMASKLAGFTMGFAWLLACAKANEDALGH